MRPVPFGIVLSIEIRAPSFFASFEIIFTIDNNPSICGEKISSVDV